MDNVLVITMDGYTSTLPVVRVSIGTFLRAGRFCAVCLYAVRVTSSLSWVAIITYNLAFLGNEARRRFFFFKHSSFGKKTSKGERAEREHFYASYVTRYLPIESQISLEASLLWKRKKPHIPQGSKKRFNSFLSDEKYWIKLQNYANWSLKIRK